MAIAHTALSPGAISTIRPTETLIGPKCLLLEPLCGPREKSARTPRMKSPIITGPIFGNQRPGR